MRYTTSDEPANSQLKSVRMDRRWFPAQQLLPRRYHGPMALRDVAARDLRRSRSHASQRRHAGGARPAVAKLAPSLVHITFDMPFAIAGVSDRNYHGTGLLVDAERGLVVTDRNTVPVSLGDVRLTFGGELEIPGRIEFINPLHNLAVVSYDPKLIGTTPVKSARLNPEPCAKARASRRSA